MSIVWVEELSLAQLVLTYLGAAAVIWFAGTRGAVGRNRYPR